MAAYLTSLAHNVTLISRREAETDGDYCRSEISSADIVAAALPDSALSDWRAAWADTIGKRPAVHFSGAVSVDGMHAYHPLYSFPPSVLPADVFPKIGFACPEDGPAFTDIFPGAPNPTFSLGDDARAHYHALAVLSGNFAAHLWNETAAAFASAYDAAPADILSTYFESIVDRFRENPLSSLTGPVARGDRISVEANVAALADDPKLSALYKAFLASAWPEAKDID